MTTAKRIKSLDIVKCIAILMVILVHSVQAIPNVSTKIVSITALGRYGCQIFFVVSGFSISLSYKSSKEKNESLGRFYLKRFAAIAPGYYLIILITQILNLILRLSFGVDLGFCQNNNIWAIICNLFFLNGLLPFCNNNIGPGGWFVGTIVIFYILFPLLFKLVEKMGKSRNALPVLFALFAMIVVAVLKKIFGVAQISAYSDFIYFSFVLQISSFVLGICLYKEFTDDKISGNNLSIILNFAISILLLCYLYFGASLALIPFIAGYAGYFMLKAFLILESRENDKLGYLKPFSYVGSKSYFVYLVHCFFVYTMPKFLLYLLNKLQIKINANVLWIILLPFMIGFSVGVAILFEKMCKPITSLILKIGKNNSKNESKLKKE